MYCYLIYANRNLTEDYFVSCSGALGGFAKELFHRIYISLFAESEDVLEIYNNYYKMEYASFAEFLIGVYKMREEWVTEIVDTLAANVEYKLINYKSLDTDDNVEDFVFSESLYNQFERLILMKP